jgi:ribosomal protein S18 acetylase RimI-like enzyme
VDLAIRRALRGDERVLAELNATVHESHVVSHPSQFRVASLDEVAAYFGELFGDEAARVWIAESAGVAVGYVSARLCERSEDVFCLDRRWMELDQISVSTDYQHSGVGRALVDRVGEAARLEGIDDVDLTRGCFNIAAGEAFRRLGFAPVTERLRLTIR